MLAWLVIQETAGGQSALCVSRKKVLKKQKSHAFNIKPHQGSFTGRNLLNFSMEYYSWHFTFVDRIILRTSSISQKKVRTHLCLMFKFRHI